MAAEGIPVLAGGVQEWANGLRFEADGASGERLLDAEGRQVVHSYERIELRRRVDELLIDEDCDVLEVGFGFGFSAERVQEARPRSHTIVECAPAVLERLKLWAAGKPGVKIVEGTWQERLPALGTFDRILLDDYGSEHLAGREMERCPDAAYCQEYQRIMGEGSGGHYEAFEGIVRRWHTRPGARVNTGTGTEFQNWADGLFFSLDRNGQEQLLDVDGAQVMMQWEKPYMERCVEALHIDESSSVLEVGFGCGYSATTIQKYNPKQHVIIECAEAVLVRLRAWAAERPNVVIVDGTWQARLPDLGKFDCIFFDDYGEPGLANREMAHCPDAKYRAEYEAALEAEAGTHFEAFVSLALRWHTRDDARITGYLLHPLCSDFVGAEVTYERIDVQVPEHCNYYFSDRAVVPLISRRKKHLESARACSIASTSTRSGRSGSGMRWSRSPSPSPSRSSRRSLGGSSARSRSRPRRRSC